MGSVGPRRREQDRSGAGGAQLDAAIRPGPGRPSPSHSARTVTSHNQGVRETPTGRGLPFRLGAGPVPAHPAGPWNGRATDRGVAAPSSVRHCGAGPSGGGDLVTGPRAGAAWPFFRAGDLRGRMRVIRDGQAAIRLHVVAAALETSLLDSLAGKPRSTADLARRGGGSRGAAPHPVPPG